MAGTLKVRRLLGQYFLVGGKDSVSANDGHVAAFGAQKQAIPVSIPVDSSNGRTNLAVGLSLASSLVAIVARKGASRRDMTCIPVVFD